MGLDTTHDCWHAARFAKEADSLRAQVADLTKERDENARELKHLRALFDEVKHQRDCYMRAAKRHEGSEF